MFIYQRVISQQKDWKGLVHSTRNIERIQGKPVLCVIWVMFWCFKLEYMKVTRVKAGKCRLTFCGDIIPNICCYTFFPGILSPKNNSLKSNISNKTKNNQQLPFWKSIFISELLVRIFLVYQPIYIFPKQAKNNLHQTYSTVERIRFQQFPQQTPTISSPQQMHKTF